MAGTPQKSEVEVTPTTSWVQMTEFGSGYEFKGISVKNYTDGDIEVAFESTTYANIVVKENTDIVYDFIAEKSPVYIRRVGGSSGTAYVRLWA